MPSASYRALAEALGENYRLLNLLSEMHAELTNPSGLISGTRGGWERFVADWCKRVKPHLIVGPKGEPCPEN